MGRERTVSLVSLGFVAGVAYTVACNGGPSPAAAGDSAAVVDTGGGGGSAPPAAAVGKSRAVVYINPYRVWADGGHPSSDTTGCVINEERGGTTYTDYDLCCPSGFTAVGFRDQGEYVIACLEDEA